MTIITPVNTNIQPIALNEQNDLAEFIQTRARLLLELDPSEGKVIARRPNDSTPAGVLYCEGQSMGEEGDSPDHFEEELGKQRVLPCRMALGFHAKELAGEIVFRVELDVWARVDDEHAEHQEWMVVDAENGPGAVPGRETPRRIIVEQRIDLGDITPGLNSLQREVNQELGRLSILASYPDEDGDHVIPNWQCTIDYEVRPHDDPDLPHTVIIAFVNSTPMLPAEDRAFATEHFFRTRLTADLTGHEDNIPKRLPRRQDAGNPRRDNVETLGYALGACPWTDPENHILQTTIIPETIQYKVKQAENLSGTIVKGLADDPVKALTAFIKEVEDSRSIWREVETELGDALSPEQLEEFRRDEAAFAQEIALMKRTKTAMADPDVLLAFKATFLALARMNENRDAAGTIAPRGAIHQLRPFQLGYVLTSIPDVISRATARDERDKNWSAKADLIFFPTGGGKTEAFQALSVFNAFYDRLKGKEVGITVWLRFALRALTVDQTNRLYETVHHAEAIRQELNIGNEPFKLGLLVGGAYTPGEVGREAQGEKKLSDVQGNIERDPTHYAYVSTCPSCYGPIHNRFDEDTWHLASFCPKAGCIGELNVLLVDDEIRRRPCAFVVGTIDKITGVGLTRRFQPLLRSPRYVCPKHGASVAKKGTPNKCGLRSDEPCDMKMVPYNRDEDWGPGMIILDEVHLLEEELAAFTAQYESALRAIQRSGGFPEPKTVLASATVAGFEKHVTELVDNEPRLFPSRSPSQDKGFWYSRDKTKIQRRVCAVLPHGKTQEDAMIDLLLALSRIRRDSLDDGHPLGLANIAPVSLADASASTWTKDLKEAFLRPYWTDFIYVLARHAGEGLRGSINEQLSSNLAIHGIESAQVPDMISSELEAPEMNKLLQELSTDEKCQWDIALATRSIAEGLDNPFFNILCLLGHPRRFNEDTQVNGRAGRKYTGMVFRILHPIMERDRNHYAYFWDYETNRDLMIEPSSINRRALRSIDHTLPGILMALMFNTEVDRTNEQQSHNVDGARNIMGRVNVRTDIKSAVDEIYKADEENYQLFTQELRGKLDGHISVIMSTAAGNARFTSDKFAKRPMTSLRDVDPGIPFFYNKHSAGNDGDRILRDFRLGVGMRRSRGQVIFQHLPDSVYQYRGGTLVRTTAIRPDTSAHRLADIDMQSVMPRLKRYLTADEYLRNIAHNDPDGSRLMQAIELVRPGSVEFEMYPLVLKCFRCNHHWSDLADRVKKKCPSCKADVNHLNTQQFPFVAVHANGAIKPVMIPRCAGCQQYSPRTINKTIGPGSGPSFWIWECDCGGTSAPLSRGTWTEV